MLISLSVQWLYALACYLYLLTLEAGDVDYLKDRIPQFLIMMLMNMVIYILLSGFVYFYFTGGKVAVRWINLGIAAAMLIGTLTFDLGTSLDNHG